MLEIGEMKPQKDPEGCGSYNSIIKTFIQSKFSELCSSIQNMSDPDSHLILCEDDRKRVWLLACLAKTIKEQTGITDPLPKLPE
jgi:hypothetical protein